LHTDQEGAREKKKQQAKFESKIQKSIIAVQCAAIVGLLAYLKYGAGKATQSAQDLNKNERRPEEGKGNVDIFLVERANDSKHEEMRGEKYNSVATRALVDYCKPTASEQVIPLLLQLGADPRHTDEAKKTLLHTTHSTILDPHTIQALAGAGVNLNATDCNGNTALHDWSSAPNEEQVIRNLLDAKANAWVQNNQGETPFMLL